LEARGRYDDYRAHRRRVHLSCRTGEWYNQRPWGMFDDDHLPAAGWHAEVEEALSLQAPRPSIVVIDMTSMAYLVIGDYTFLVGLSKRLHAAEIRLAVLARANAIYAYSQIREKLAEPFEMLATLEEVLPRE